MIYMVLWSYLDTYAKSQRIGWVPEWIPDNQMYPTSLQKTEKRRRLCVKLIFGELNFQQYGRFFMDFETFCF